MYFIYPEKYTKFEVTCRFTGKYGKLKHFNMKRSLNFDGVMLKILLHKK